MKFVRGTALAQLRDGWIAHFHLLIGVLINASIPQFTFETGVSVRTFDIFYDGGGGNRPGELARECIGVKFRIRNRAPFGLFCCTETFWIDHVDFELKWNFNPIGPS